MKPLGRRKCLCCKKLFVPDPRNRRHQWHCAKAACQQTRTAAAVRRGGGRPETRKYWHGDDNAARARAWQKAHPGYWKCRKKRARVLQVVCAVKVVVLEQDNPEVL